MGRCLILHMSQVQGMAILFFRIMHCVIISSLGFFLWPYNLGFLSNPRRFNVVITRARSLLVVVGNPHIVAKDIHWCKLLRHCVDNGSYQGCPLPVLEDHDYPKKDARYNSGPKIPQSSSSHTDKCIEEPIEHEQCQIEAIWVKKHQEHTLSGVASVSNQLAEATTSRERKQIGMKITSQMDSERMVTK